MTKGPATRSGLPPRFCDETRGARLEADLDMNNWELPKAGLAFAVDRNRAATPVSSLGDFWGRTEANRIIPSEMEHELPPFSLHAFLSL